MTKKEGEFTWIDVTDDLERESIAFGTDRGVQYLHGQRVIFTLVFTPAGRRKLVPGQPLANGEYKVVIDYDTDPDDGVGAVHRKTPHIEWIDITHECKVELRPSTHTSGYYNVVTHKGTQVAILGVDGIKLCSTKGEYKLEKPEKARVSFSLFKKVTH